MKTEDTLLKIRYINPFINFLYLLLFCRRERDCQSITELSLLKYALLESVTISFYTLNESIIGRGDERKQPTDSAVGCSCL